MPLAAPMSGSLLAAFVSPLAGNDRGRRRERADPDPFVGPASVQTHSLGGYGLPFSTPNGAIAGGSGWRNGFFLCCVAWRSSPSVFWSPAPFSPVGSRGGVSGSRRTERVFVLDDSMSMGFQAADGPIFQRQIRRPTVARTHQPRNARRHRHDPSGFDPAEPLVAGAFLDQAQLEQVLARLEAMTPSQRASDPEASFRGIAERSPAILRCSTRLFTT